MPVARHHSPTLGPPPARRTAHSTHRPLSASPARRTNNWVQPNYFRAAYFACPDRRTTHSTHRPAHPLGALATRPTARQAPPPTRRTDHRVRPNYFRVA
ncbi:hypothetical protein [Nocardia nepalensis]|uniref:hypothetical protein n=1 Tax=Nocardia nepalensis TaxID=3375448 RepID=UPI003B67DD76